MKKQQKDITITLIAILFVFFLGVAIATGMESKEVNCQPMQDDWTVAEVKAMQTICEQEKLENKEKRSELDLQKKELNKRNDEIRGRYDNILLSHSGTVEVKNQEIIEETINESSRYIPGGKIIPSSITGNTKAKRFTNFVRYFARGFDESVFVQARNRYGVKEEVLACIAWADSDLGNANKSVNNIMNYGNNDKGDTKNNGSVLESVMAAAHGLTEGRYLSTNKIIGELSQGGRTHLGLPGCAEQGVFCYATSPENWRRNVNNCLTFIEGERKDRDNMSIVK